MGSKFRSSLVFGFFCSLVWHFAWSKNVYLLLHYLGLIRNFLSCNLSDPLASENKAHLYVTGLNVRQLAFRFCVIISVRIQILQNCVLPSGGGEGKGVIEL